MLLVAGAHMGLKSTFGHRLSPGPAPVNADETASLCDSRGTVKEGTGLELPGARRNYVDAPNETRGGVTGSALDTGVRKLGRGEAFGAYVLLRLEN
jgi:hypothetical protein